MPYRRCMAQASVHLNWPPESFWRATPHEFVAAMMLYQEIHCAESPSEKRRKFAIFKKDVEAGDKERRWRQEQERRKRPARQAKAPKATAPKTPGPAGPRRKT